MAAPHLYEQIAANKRKSWFLVVAIVTLFSLVGSCIGVYVGEPLWGIGAAVFALGYASIGLAFGDRLVLASIGAKSIEKKDAPLLFNVVEEMAIAAGLPLPAIYLIPSNASNAFATGRNPRKASIAVTTGLLEILNREELQAVIGHEMAHIKNFDTRFAVLMAILVGATALLCDAFWRIGRRSRGSAQVQVIVFALAVVLLILAPLAAKIIQLGMSRRRELLADGTSAELTRNPVALARALEKIAADPDPLDITNRGVQHLFIVNPLHRSKGATEKGGWFDTHPPLRLRIKLLQEIGHGK